jgi:hypothetical protein
MTTERLTEQQIEETGFETPPELQKKIDRMVTKLRYDRAFARAYAYLCDGHSEGDIILKIKDGMLKRVIGQAAFDVVG